MSMIKPRTVSGFPDYTEPENIALSQWFSAVENIFRDYGFSRLFPRPLELREVLLAKGGAAKQIFGVSRLMDDSATELALPFDRTVPLANWIARYGGDTVFPYKRFDISYSYRGERAQAGRFQAFFQADVDIVGSGELELGADAETIAVIYRALATLQAGEAYLRVNHIALSKCLLRDMGFQDDAALAAAFKVADNRLKVSEAEFRALAESELKLSGDALERFVSAFGYEGPLEGFLERFPLGEAATEAVETSRQLFALLRSMGTPTEAVAFCPCVVRGLDYYTGVVFEAFIRGLERYGSVGGGGRYDDLASTFTKARYPGSGGTIGLSRLFEIARKEGLMPMTRRTEAEIFVGFRAPELMGSALEAATLLRKTGFKVDFYAGRPKIKNQLAYADRKGFPLALLVMDANSFVVRDMAAGGQEDINELCAAVAAISEKAEKKRLFE